MTNRQTDYLIIGNSAAGVTAAEYIRANDAHGSILIVSREPYPAYGRPLISYLLEGKTTERAMALKPEGFYEGHAIDTLLGPEYEVVKLDADAHTVELANNEAIAYGKCLLATGSVPFVPPIKGLDGKRNVYSFLTLDDAKAVLGASVQATEAVRCENRPSRALVVGAGLIGLKAAEAVSHHVDEVLVLELAPRILPSVLDAAGADLLQSLLAERGIECRSGVSAEEFVGEDGAITGAVLTDGAEVTCDFVIAAVGVRPNSALAVEAGAEQGKGLVCGTDLATSLPDVYAAGDVVQVTDLLDGSKKPLALWPNAIRQGKAAGLFMAGCPDAEPFEGNFAVNAVDFFDISLLTAGIINPPDDGAFEVRLLVDGSTYAKFVIADDRLVGYILLNRPANAGIYTAMIEQRVPLDSLSDPFGSAPANLDFPADVRWARLHTCYPHELDERGWKETA